MTLQDVLGLFALVGGTVFVTFQIVWTVTHDKKRKWPPRPDKAAVISV